MKQKGFTLIELMVVVVIVGILAAFAVPSYQKYLKNSRLQEAKAALLDNAQFMSRYYSRHYRYKKNSTTWPDLPKKETAFFTIAFSSKAKGEKTEHYRLHALAKESYSKTENRYLEIDQDQNIKLCTPKGKRSRRCSPF